MLTEQENELLTRTGPGASGGDLMRHYWQPAALAEELPPGGAPVAVRLLGEDLALFRDDQAQLGLIGLHCPHRGADLTYGRLEDGGLRCIYHGWLFDVAGQCLEQPGEPAGSDFYRKIRDAAYPVQERAGVIFAYLGPGEPPLLPDYEFLLAPDDRRVVGKAFHDCNYLQGNEGNIDPGHLSFLHRMFREGDGWARANPVPGGAESGNTLFGRDTAPTIDVEETDFGLRICTVRGAGKGKQYVRVSNFIYPNLAAFPGQGDGYSVNWHVPIDDFTHWKYTFTFQRSGPIDPRTARAQRDAEFTIDYRPIRHRENRYLQDREEMGTRSFAGVGASFVIHDAVAVEGAGPIQDRTQEHLGSTDKAIVMQRLLLLKAIHQVQSGQQPPHLARDGDGNRFPDLGAMAEVVPASVDPRTLWEGRVNAATNRATMGAA